MVSMDTMHMSKDRAACDRYTVYRSGLLDPWLFAISVLAGGNHDRGRVWNE